MLDVCMSISRDGGEALEFRRQIPQGQYQLAATDAKDVVKRVIYTEDAKDAKDQGKNVVKEY